PARWCRSRSPGTPRTSWTTSPTPFRRSARPPRPGWSIRRPPRSSCAARAGCPAPTARRSPTSWSASACSPRTSPNWPPSSCIRCWSPSTAPPSSAPGRGWPRPPTAPTAPGARCPVRRPSEGRLGPAAAWDTSGMTTALPADLLTDLETAGYFPQTAAQSLERSLRGARPVAHLVRPETTFDGPEVRRHLTGVVLTDTHLLVTHLHDDPADALSPSQVVSTTERIPRRSSTAPGPSQVFDTDGKGSPDAEAEITLGISWDGSRRVDLEPAVCEDPNCQIDHGYTGTIAPSDLALRV